MSPDTKISTLETQKSPDTISQVNSRFYRQVIAMQDTFIYHGSVLDGPYYLRWS